MRIIRACRSKSFRNARWVIYSNTIPTQTFSSCRTDFHINLIITANRIMRIIRACRNKFIQNARLVVHSNAVTAPALSTQGTQLLLNFVLGIAYIFIVIICTAWNIIFRRTIIHCIILANSTQTDLFIRAILYNNPVIHTGCVGLYCYTCRRK